MTWDHDKQRAELNRGVDTEMRRRATPPLYSFWGPTEIVLASVIGLLICLAVAIMVVSYRPTHETVVAPDGKPAVLVTCSSAGDCMREAAEVCPRGHDVLSRSEQRGQSTTIVNAGHVMVPVTSDTYDGAVMVRCR